MNIKNIVDNFKENESVLIKGRVKRVRILSKKLAFFVLEETDSQIQVGVRTSNLPKAFDIIECKGITGFSETKEKTVWIEDFILLSKCDGELPSFKGISDGKLIAEKRYLNILTDKKLKDNLLFRANLIKNIRKFLWSKDFVEIETPILSTVPSGASAEPFITKSNALNRDFYLRIATETALKKAIVSNFERVFEIGKIFRNEGIDKTHSPEFTSIEIYQSYGTLIDMKKIIYDLMYQFGGYSPTEDYNEFDYDELVFKYGEDFDKFLIAPTFVFNQPLEQTPLCAAKSNGRADRFEFYVNGFEVANAYNELTNWEEQKNRLNGANDDGLSEALKYGCPPLAGIGIGIDRLVMALKKVDRISDVIVFP